MSNQLQGWLIIAMNFCSLCGIVVTGWKIVSRNEREWERKEAQLDRHDNELLELRRDTTRLTAVEAKLVELMSEMSRVRDRLDRFLDNQSASRG